MATAMLIVERARIEGWTDEEIVARVRDGETALFEIIMRRYNQRLYRVTRGILALWAIQVWGILPGAVGVAAAATRAGSNAQVSSPDPGPKVGPAAAALFSAWLAAREKGRP